jgi:hypothetical protein
MADHRARIAHDFALGRFSFARKNNKIGLGERARALCMEVVALEWPVHGNGVLHHFYGNLIAVAADFVTFVRLFGYCGYAKRYTSCPTLFFLLGY